MLRKRPRGRKRQWWRRDERPESAAVRGPLNNTMTFMTSKESGPVTQEAEVNENDGDGLRDE